MSSVDNQGVKGRFVFVGSRLSLTGQNAEGVNLIKEGSNYGWPVSSYGEKYGEKDDQKEKPFYKKSHIEYNFQEPIFSFVPSIGISEIIKVGNNFSEFWKDSFLITSLNDQHIYRVNFDKEYQKVKYYETPKKMSVMLFQTKKSKKNCV